MKTLIVGSTKFAASASALVDTLFALDGTASGLFRVRRNSILFMLPDGAPFACLVANPGQSQFFVSAHRQDDGKTRYMFGLSDADERRLGISGLKYSAQSDEAERVWKSAAA